MINPLSHISKLKAALVVAILFFVSLTPAVNAVPANEDTRYEINVSDFSELKVVDDIPVIYRAVADSVGKAVFTAPASTASSIMFQCENGKLVIQKASETNGVELPVITVYSTYLTKVENNGNATVKVEWLQPGPKFSATVIGNGHLIVNNLDHHNISIAIKTGNGEIIARGKGLNVKILNTGTGQIQADELEADNVKCSLWGTGSVGCAPSTKLSVGGAGTGTVYYLGTPEIKNHSLGVKTEQLDK